MRQFGRSVGQTTYTEDFYSGAHSVSCHGFSVLYCSDAALNPKVTLLRREKEARYDPVLQKWRSAIHCRTGQ